MHTVEQFATSVAVKVTGPEPQVSSALIEMIMQLIMSLIGNCPKPASLSRSVKSPTIRQRAYFRAQVMDGCSICFRAQFRPQAGAIADELISQSAALDDADIASIAFDAVNPDFVVI